MAEVRWIGGLSVSLVLNASYLGAFAQPNLFYLDDDWVHVSLGVLLFG